MRSKDSKTRAVAVNTPANEGRGTCDSRRSQSPVPAIEGAGAVMPSQSKLGERPLLKRIKKSVVPAVAPVTASPTEPLLLDIKAAAHTLSCTVWAVRSLLWSRQIPFIRIGHRFLIDPADLRAYIQRQKEGAA